MLDIDKMKKDFDNFINSEKGKKSLDGWHQKMEYEDAFNSRWTNKFVDFLKDKTDEELDGLYVAFNGHAEKRSRILFSQGIDGETDLYQYLLDAFIVLGIEADEDAYGMFVSSVYDWRGFRCELYCGQGCFTKISRL